VLADEDADDGGEVGGRLGVRETTGMALLCVFMIQVVGGV